MISIAKKVSGMFAVACLVASPAVFADESGGSPSQLQNPPTQGQFQNPAQLQTPTQGQQFQGQGFNAQQQQQLQKSVAVIVKVPKNQSGQEMPMQAQAKLRVGDMAQQGNTDKDIEAIWNEETIDLPADLLQENADVATSPDMEAATTYPWGWRYSRLFRWGFIPRPIFYGAPYYNYYYYPRVGYYPYRYGYGYRYGRCRFGRC